MCDIYHYVCAKVSPVETVLFCQKRYYTTTEAAARFREEAVVYEPRGSFYNTAGVSAIKTGSKDHDAQAAPRLGDEARGLGEDTK